MKRILSIVLGLSALGAALSPAEERPRMPDIKAPVLFNTPEADKILAALQVFPPDNPWNEDVSKLPLLPNSKEMIAGIGADKRLGVQPRHVVHPCAAGPEEGAGQDQELP